MSDNAIFVKLIIEGASATPAPPVGSALGPRGINIMQFCKQFNEQTKDQKGIPFRVEIYVYADKKFSFVLKKPGVSWYVKQKAKIKSGAKKPGLEIVANISMNDVEEIAKEKAAEFNSQELESMKRMIIGTARSMGITVK